MAAAAAKRAERFDLDAMLEAYSGLFQGLAR
jgi:hypothetical protein